MQNTAHDYERSRYEILRKKIGSETSILYIVFQNSAPPKVNRSSKEDDLVFEGQDLGDIVEDMFGDSDYEYDYHIERSNVDYFVACLMKECFDRGVFVTGGQLRSWMEKNNIPFNSWSWT